MNTQLAAIITACAPILVALIGIIPTVISNRKKTEEMVKKLQCDNQNFTNKINSSISLLNSSISELDTRINNIDNKFNGLNDRVEEVDNKLIKMREMLYSHIKENEETAQKQRRVRIIRFVDEISEGQVHKQDHWDEIWEDVNQYEAYVNSHPNYINNKGVASMNFIKSHYDMALNNKIQN